MKNRLSAFATLLFVSCLITSHAPVLAEPAADQGLPVSSGQQLMPMQPIIATPANYYPVQPGGAYPPQGYPPQMQSPQAGAGYPPPPQYAGQPYPQGNPYAPQQYPGQPGGQMQPGQPYAAGVSEAVPQQSQPPSHQQSSQRNFQQSPSAYEMQEQAIQTGHMQNRSDLDKYAPPPEVPDAAPDPSYQGEVNKGPGMKGVAGKAGGILKRGVRMAAPLAASFLITTAAYKMSQNRSSNQQRSPYGNSMYGGMPMGGYGMPMSGMGMPGNMYGMPGMGMGMPMYGTPGW